MLCCLKGHLSWVVQWKAVDWIRVHLTGFVFRSLQEGIRGLCYFFLWGAESIELKHAKACLSLLRKLRLKFPSFVRSVWG